MTILSPTEVVIRYHEETKHHFHRYARSLGYMDWATQPCPFRYYEGAHRLDLNRFPSAAHFSFDELYAEPNLPSRPVDSDSLSEFLRYGVGISAWKEYQGQRWSLRVDPSSGNLHPSEVYCVFGASSSFASEPSIYHYVSETHSLERRGQLNSYAWQSFVENWPTGSFLVVVSSIHWRESWKYGERAYRYCQHDAGHVLACLRFSAAMLGWNLKLYPGWSDENISRLAGLSSEGSSIEFEREVGDFIALVSPTKKNECAIYSSNIESVIREAQWFGRANQLSSDHVSWDIIDDVHAAAYNPGSESDGQLLQTPIRLSREYAPANPLLVDAHKIILKRRSAQKFDGVGRIPNETFFRMLTRTLPDIHAPWDAMYWPPYIHLVLFVHRVDELAEGIYMLVRNNHILDTLKQAMLPDFSWQKPDSSPDELPLYLLKEGDFSEVAKQLSCQQDIAGDGFFSLGMLAEFSEPIQKWGPWFYRNLFWETGVIGQVLYLEAEAVNARATGIGCFFDDAVHDVLGLKGNTFQILYHFTLGTSVTDQRLTTLPAYAEI